MAIILCGLATKSDTQIFHGGNFSLNITAKNYLNTIGTCNCTNGAIELCVCLPRLQRQAAAREELLCECEPRNTIHTDEQSPYTSERSVLSAALAGYMAT